MSSFNLALVDKPVLATQGFDLPKSVSLVAQLVCERRGVGAGLEEAGVLVLEEVGVLGLEGRLVLGFRGAAKLANGLVISALHLLWSVLCHCFGTLCLQMVALGDVLKMAPVQDLGHLLGRNEGGIKRKMRAAQVLSDILQRPRKFSNEGVVFQQD
ncbi:hypothetical protein SERLADRAFT_404751 [Serpula lacrymans var. lacrymans S7.9]|uniref:Uncharacterized protein n=1 Tax=Serpula lacrymans var. lacrymans (strain S7.9) TaxID=578457 RepID=F8NEQ4_SERL9|nr:uncharacterized protein SERLADRAFT_404751 [Serpula lacrymans var. lacrymans S7.9]EGO30688.1 hypothetical protein SERLADRAFT_404751 [Serpula lacrymans var. lacrymans S7.9]